MRVSVVHSSHRSFQCCSPNPFPHLSTTEGKIHPFFLPSFPPRQQQSASVTSSTNRRFRSFLRTLAMADNSSVVEPQKIIVSNRHGVRLVGLLHDTGSKEVVVLCHGFRANKGDKTLVNLAIALENEGISAFRFDFAGNGESDGSFQFGNYMEEVEDLSAVVKHLTGLNRIVSAIVGHSKGGNIVLLYASKCHDISTVLNLSGRYKLDRGIKERLGEEFLETIKKDGYIDVKNKAGKVLYRVTEDSLMERLNTNMHEACLRISEYCRVLTVHGSADEIIPVEDGYEFSKIIPNHKLVIIEGADHCYNLHQAELASAVLDFIKTCLSKI